VKIRRRANADSEKIESGQLPMISICILLALFFMLALRTSPPESGAAVTAAKAAEHHDGRADENGVPLVAAKAVADGSPAARQSPVIKVRLQSDSKGFLDGILLNERRIKDLEQLRDEVRTLVYDARGPQASSTEIELDCDYHLKYAETMQAITTLSSCPSADGKTLVKLIDRVNFSPRRKP
jgi:biopolymer transport protein ExbD